MCTVQLNTVQIKYMCHIFFWLKTDVGIDVLSFVYVQYFSVRVLTKQTQTNKNNPQNKSKTTHTHDTLSAESELQVDLKCIANKHENIVDCSRMLMIY